MKKIVSVLLTLSLSLIARENPFFPSEGEVDIPITSNQIKRLPPLKRATLKLPSSARSVESVTIRYKTLDGDIKEQTANLQNSIDWHLPIFISQSMDTQNSKSSIKKVSHKKFHKMLSLKYISLYDKDKELKIVTKDTMIRNFTMVEPHRIIMDFKRDIDMRSYFSKIDSKRRFVSARVGNHMGYYRVVVTLDGEYIYSVSKTTDGYLVTIR